MSMNLLGVVVGAAVALLLLRFPLRGYKQTWWAGTAFAMIFFTLGPMLANAIRGKTMNGHWDEAVVAVLLIIPTVLGTKRRAT